jgi:hypothetical protein
MLFVGQVIGQMFCFTAIILAEPSDTKRQKMVTILTYAIVFSYLGTFALAMFDFILRFDNYKKMVARRLPEGHRHAFLRRMAINLSNGMAWAGFIFQFVSLLPIFVALVWIAA